MTSRHRSASLAVLTMFLALGCGKVGKPTPNSAGPEPGKSVVDKKADFSVTANQLAKDFFADEKSATAKYTDKVVEVEGTLYTASPVIAKPGTFILDGAKKNEKDILGVNLYCSCPAGHENKVMMLGKGQKVKVKGVFQGANPLGIYLGDCSYTEVTPSPSVVVSAKQLAEDYAKDKDAADKKYRDKEVVVEGEVADLVNKDGFFSAKLAGARAPLAVSCTIRKEEFDALKKGQKVTIKGDCSLFADNVVTVNTAFIVQK